MIIFQINLYTKRKTIFIDFLVSKLKYYVYYNLFYNFNLKLFNLDLQTMLLCTTFTKNL